MLTSCHCNAFTGRTMAVGCGILLRNERHVPAELPRVPHFAEAGGVPPRTGTLHEKSARSDSSGNVPPRGNVPHVEITLIRARLVLGPSNSQKKTPCHVPNMRAPSEMMMCTELPMREALMCASAFPSLCR